MALHPTIKALLDTVYASTAWREYCELTPEEAREQSWQMGLARVLPEPLAPVTKQDLVADENGYQVPVRVYQPENRQSDALIIYYHGGGHVLGSVEQHDGVVEIMAAKTGIPVVSVDYPLAPEHSYEQLVEAAYAAFVWTAKHADSLGVPYQKLVVAGDSAGGHLAAMVSLLARDRSGPDIALQWLIYPWINDDLSYASYQTFAEGYLLSLSAMDWFLAHYYHHGKDLGIPAFPLKFADFSDLPPAYIALAECDVLVDEGKHYAEVLTEAGNEVVLDMFDGHIHGFIGMYPTAVCYEAYLEMLDKIGGLLES